ncbi:hypothetical protein GOV04_03255 [Candidatus Woesearchaeota archaeon]|nr:hypothetical protein [Candidatus Woesearchaeota archaeon]
MALVQINNTKKFSLLMTSEKNYYKHLNKIVQKFNQKHIICYVCLARPYMEVIEDFKSEGVSTKNFYFIDAVTKIQKSMVSTENATLISSPTVIALEKSIKKAIKEKKCSMLLFDTVSVLLMYEKKQDILKFTHNLLSKDEFENTVNIYIVIKDLGIKEEENRCLVNDLRMLADEELFYN